MQDVCKSLSTLASLNELNINIENSEEVDLIREELPKLQILNGYPLFEDSQEEQDNSQVNYNINNSQVEGFEVAGEVGFDLTQHDLESIAELYDQIRDQLKQFKVGNDTKYASDFDSLSLAVAKDLKQVLHLPSHSVNKKCCIVKNKYLM